MPDFNKMTELNVGLYLFAAVIALLMLVGAVLDQSRRRPFMKAFICQILSCILMLLGETGLELLEGRPEMVPLEKLCCLFSYGCGYTMVASYAYSLIGFIKEKENISWKDARIVAALCAGFTLLAVISIFNGMLFYFDENGVMHYTKWHRLVRIFDCTALILEILMVLRYHKVLGRRGTLSLLTVGIFPLISMPLQFFWDTTPMYLSNILAMLVMYMLYHGTLTWKLAETKRQLAENEKKLTESRISTMLSQIQPHFIYNTLGTIEQLCLDQPETASELVHNFSLYLRGNFSELDHASPIRLSQEIEHVRNYVSIEHIRFPDMEVQFDLRSDDFLLPALSVQPLVENAIKHGLMGLESGGTITVSAYETDTSYCVRVVDDGVGFDTSVLQDERTHIGIRNIRGRIEAMCGGTLTVESAPGKGTTAIITIPKERE